MLPDKRDFTFLEEAQKEALYEGTILQLNKDFQLASLDYKFEFDEHPDALVKKTGAIISHLLKNEYDAYLNFMYRVDVSEKELAKIHNLTLEKTIAFITWAVLKREFQKVWFRNKV